MMNTHQSGDLAAGGTSFGRAGANGHSCGGKVVDGGRGEGENRVSRENRHRVTETYPLHTRINSGMYNSHRTVNCKKV